ncbi:MAG: hemerythrin domain-containing protein [Verrucomicrobiota bacterium]
MTAFAFRAAVAGFRREHERLRRHTSTLEAAARELPTLSYEERQTLIRRIVAVLEGDIEPHTRAEEEALYPTFERHLRPGALHRMGRDHARLRGFEHRLVATDVRDTTSLQETLFDLHGLLETHLKKEEEIFLPLLADEPDEQLDRLFRAMTRTAGPESPHEKEVAECRS